MNRVLLIIITILVLTFSESFLGYSGGASLLIVMGLILFRRTDIYTYLIIILPVSIVNDITDHILTGGTFFAIYIATIFFTLLKRFLPYESNLFVKGVLLIFTTTVYHFLLFILFYTSNGEFTFSEITFELLFLIFKLSLFELILFVLFNTLLEYVGSGRNRSVIH